MDLTSLEIFEAVAEHRSVTRAAATIGRVPSNVTSRIQQLESDLQISLFNRDGRRMVLTREGETLLGYAKRIRMLAAEARQALHTVPLSGALAVGAMESTAVSRLPEALARYRALYPDVTVRLEMGATRELARDVAAGSLDCALVARPSGAHQFERSVSIPQLEILHAEQVFTEEILIVLPANHLDIRNASDLKVSGLAALEPGCTYRRIAEAWGRSSAALKTLEVSSYHAILASVAAGETAGVMPRSVFEMLQWPDKPKTHSLGHVGTFLVRRKEAVSPPIEAFRDLLLTQPAPHRPRAPAN